jgi:multiple sugar transport system substrate-binding protein
MTDIRRGNLTRSQFLNRAAGVGFALGAGGILAACGDDDEKSTGSKRATKADLEGGTLNLLSWEDAAWTAVAGIAKQWGKENGVTVKSDTVPFANAYQKVVLLSQSESDEFDIYCTDAIYNEGFAASGWIASLDDIGLPVDAYIPGLIDDFSRSADGTLYSQPITFSFIMTLYLKSAYRKAGIKAPGTTWEALQEDLTKLQASNLGMAPLITLVNDTDGTVWDWGAQLTGQNLPEGARQFLYTDDYKPAFDNPAGLAGLERWLDWKRYSQKGASSADYSAGLTTFSQRGAATWLNWSTWASVFEADDSAIKGDVGYAMLPSDPSASDPRFFGDTYSLTLNANAANADVAKAFMQHMATPEAQAALRDSGGVVMPVLAEALEDPEWAKRPYWPVVGEAVGKLCPSNTTVTQFPELEKLTVNELQAGWVDGKPAGEVQQNLIDAYNGFFSENGYS